MTAASGGWSRVKSELLAVLELEPAMARERLRALASESPELAAEVAQLVAHADESVPFLEVPALERGAVCRRLAAESPDFAPNRKALEELERRRPGTG